ncbi:hypothetical protein EIN_341910 [Entamoeba invadens IP1]|uniref:SET domain-containing protein n=1 Tax=Entamoeba invadens IP1 TaxID=370355 RepID=A0A0A1UGC7_ENTIV|nr:hypothetical protein EIN_341910 [Entamoeba invadens IP1]ELP94773.1 hypothetical protein EIN_341910 [Entamoeba invadens IP1]|eukprot:XP_004261544.1 hypothetical protein EIN_341910 [Entamoeba invadens IP1]
MEGITTWVKEHGGHIDGVYVKNFPVYGNGLCSSKEFHEGDTLLSIPYHLQLNTIELHNVFESMVPGFEVPRLGEGAKNRDDENSVVYLYLAMNKTNEKCFHFPYINTLPTTFSCPLSYSENELKMLKGTKLLVTVEKTKTFLKKLSDYYETLTHQYPTRFQQFDDFYQRLVWAHQVFWSRAFLVIYPDPIGDVASLIPFADFSNHNTETKVTYVSNRQTQTFSLQTNEKVLHCGEQIFNNYRIRPNEKMLLGYGFVISENPYDEVLLRINFKERHFEKQVEESEESKMEVENKENERMEVEEEDNEDEITQILKREGVDRFDYYLTREKELPTDLLRVLRIVNLSLVEANQYSQALLDLSYVSPINEIKATRSLMEQIKHLLGLMEYSDDEFAQLNTKNLDYKVFCILTYKLGQVTILKNSLLLCRSKIGAELQKVSQNGLSRATETLSFSCDDFLFENFVDNLNTWLHASNTLNSSVSYVCENHTIKLRNQVRLLEENEEVLTVPLSNLITEENIKMWVPSIKQEGFTLCCVEFFFTDVGQQRLPYVPLLLKYIESMTFYSNDFKEIEESYIMDEMNCVEDDGIAMYQQFISRTRKTVPVSLFVGLYNYVDSHTAFLDETCALIPLPILPKQNPCYALCKEKTEKCFVEKVPMSVKVGEDICDDFGDDSSVNQIVHFLRWTNEFEDMDYFEAKSYVEREEAEAVYREMCSKNRVPHEIFLTQDQTNFDVFELYVAIHSIPFKKLLNLMQSGKQVEVDHKKTLEYIGNELEVIDDALQSLNQKLHLAKEHNAVNKIVQINMLLLHFQSQKRILENAKKHIEVK